MKIGQPKVSKMVKEAGYLVLVFIIDVNNTSTLMITGRKEVYMSEDGHNCSYRII
jgi:hypothetical protein